MSSRRCRNLMLAFLLGIGLLGQCPLESRACPNCKEAVSLDTSEMANTSSGYNWSVLFMLVVPASLFGTGAFMVHRACASGHFARNVRS